MARRKRKDEEPEWTPPEFDEVGYMRKEIESALVALVVVAWSAIGAGLAYALYIFVHPVVGSLVGLAAFGVLYVLLPMLGLPIEGFKRRDWFGHASIYFFSWLAFFILLLNPPFGDHTPPTVQFVAVGSYVAVNGSDPSVRSIYCWPPAGTTDVPMSYNATSNNTLYVIVRATDNVAVTSVVAQVTQQSTGIVNVTPTFVEGRPNACSNTPAGSLYLPGAYAIKVIQLSSSVVFSATARDAADLTSVASMTVLPQ